MRSIILFAVCLFFSRGLQAQAPVWSTDIAPILYNNCASCHRPSGIAPFSLLTYSDASMFGGAIKTAVQNRHMPPWPPDPSYSRFAHERRLSQQEIDKIADWVNGGQLPGDLSLAPPVPAFSNTGDLPGTPDLVAQIPTYTSTASSGDIYQCFVIPSGLNLPRYISAFEAVPGNRPLVHHVLVFSDTTGICGQLDAASSGPGYTTFGGVGTGNAKLIGGWVPGSTPMQYPPGFGMRLPANADIVIQIHYPAGTAGEQDSTKINFFFTPNNNVRGLVIEPALNHMNAMTNGPLVIPANQTRTFNEHYEVPSFLNVSLLGLAPHMHLIGRNITSFAVSPAGDTQKLIRINNWDFHWQGFYMFPKLKKIVGGTDLYATAFYDNTDNNPYNPNNPPQLITAGEGTSDEMMLIYFIYTLYQPGDENIVIDSTVLASAHPLPYYHDKQFLELYPNPASGKVYLKCYLEQSSPIQVIITDMGGKLATAPFHSFLAKGYHALPIELPALPAGTYQVQFSTLMRRETRKLVIGH